MEHGRDRHPQRGASIGRPLTPRPRAVRRQTPRPGDILRQTPRPGDIRRQTPRPRAVRRRALAVLIPVLTVVASGCTVSHGGARPIPAPGRGPNPAVRLSPAAPTTTTEPPLPVAPVQWTPCGSLQCGSVTAPLDYAHPAGPTLQIALARHPAEVPAERIGSLVINPGGPGGSGINDLPNELSVLPSELLDRFDIVSFDPRGVERSSPVSCSVGSGSTSGPAVDPVPATPSQQLALLESDHQFAGACEQASGNLLPYVGTVDAARDLDRIRQAVGDAGLTYVGHSYGTLLGATYAELFPTHVRAMVLDGAIDPALSTVQYLEDQANSLEADLQQFFAWCAGNAGCAWRPAGDPTAALLALIQRAADAPLPSTGGSTAGPGSIYDTLLAGLEAQSSWPSLAGALAEANAGNGSAANSMSGQYDTGGSTNGAVAEQAIDCLDHPTNRNPSTYPALAAQAGQSAPIFGPLFAWGILGCAIWPVLPTRTPAPASDPGAPPILVVGTSGDPVTPYKWAVGLAGELTGGALLTWQGRSHVAYFYSPCVRAAYQTYLVSGVTPVPGTICTD
jgi:pimeloyl-ACP methyl ester carboxylesterase